MVFLQRNRITEIQSLVESHHFLCPCNHSCPFNNTSLKHVGFSPCMRIFVISKRYRTTWSRLVESSDGNWGCKMTMDAEEAQRLRAHSKLYADFQPRRGAAPPNPCLVQGPTALVCILKQIPDDLNLSPEKSHTTCGFVFVAVVVFLLGTE